MTGIGVAALVAKLVQTPAPVQTGPLDVERAVAIAIRNAFAVRLQDSRVEQARQRSAFAGAELGPRAGANLGLTRIQSPQGQQFGNIFIITQPLYQRTFNGQIDLPIDISGNLNRLKQAAQLNERASRRTFDAFVNDTRLNARSVYFNVLRAETLVGVQNQNVADAQERLRQARLQFEQAQIARVDVERFEAQLVQADSEALVARNNLELARQQFNFVLARPIETPVVLVDNDALPPVPIDAEAAVPIAQRQRPEVLAVEDQIRAFGLTARALEQALNPSLSVGVNYFYNFDAINQQPPDRATFNLNLNLPIFDSGRTRAQVRAARQDVVQARINLEQQRLTVSQDVRQGFVNLTIARARYDNAVRQVTLAEEVFRLARIRQDAATGTYVEVIDAQTQLVLARSNRASARFDYQLAYSQLQRAIGRDDFTAGPTTAPPEARPAKTPDKGPVRGGNR